MANVPGDRAGGPIDVVVVGAGGCGLAAALAAAQKDARVLVLEKTEEPGGTTALSAGSVVGAGSRYQRAESIEDKPESLIEDILGRNEHQSDRELTEALARSSAVIVEWLADTMGPPVEIRARTSGHNTRRFHTWGTGKGLVDHLTAAVLKQANIELRYSAPVVSLQRDADGAVSGVMTPSGPVPARKVVLATGGFGASRELLQRYIPKAVEMPYGGHRGSTGDGMRLGEEEGAAMAYLDSFQPYPSYIVPGHLEVPGAAIFYGSIHVDRQGKRFGNETLFPGGIGAGMMELSGFQAYQIFDQHIHHLLGGGLAPLDEAGLLVKGDTPRELAHGLGIDPSGLQGTVEEYNRTAEEGTDAFGRSVSASLGTPLYGVKVSVALHHTQGGLTVNTDAQVLRPDGSVIPNLYAGGGAAAGISGYGPEGYLPGNGLMQALGLGKRSGDHAAGSLGRSA